ncbi:uncharacterized protein ACBR49_017294 [Aulostomus maculatus]
MSLFISMTPSSSPSPNSNTSITSSPSYRNLLENSLYVEAEKCEFHVSLVSFLGTIVAQGNIQIGLMDTAKVSAVTSWPIPENFKQLRRFLGFANFYHCFIHNYSFVADPLTAPTSSKVPFQWSPPAATAFKTLIDQVTSPPILQMPDPERQFVVEVDASSRR